MSESTVDALFQDIRDTAPGPGEGTSMLFYELIRLAARRLRGEVTDMGKHGDGKPADQGTSNPDRTGRYGDHHGGNLHGDDTGGATPGGAGGTG